MNKFKTQSLVTMTVGGVLILIGPFIPSTGPGFFIIVMSAIIISLSLKPLLKIRSDEVRRRVEIRREIMNRRPVTAWMAIGFGIILPLLFGIGLFTVFAFSYESAAIIFIGASYLGSGYVQLRLHDETIAIGNATFD